MKILITNKMKILYEYHLDSCGSYRIQFGYNTTKTQEFSSANCISTYIQCACESKRIVYLYRKVVCLGKHQKAC